MLIKGAPGIEVCNKISKRYMGLNKMCAFTKMTFTNGFTSLKTFICVFCWDLFMTVQLTMMTLSNGNIFRVMALFCGESTGGFPSQRPVTRSFGVFFDLRLNKRISKKSRRQWFEKSSRSLWRHCNQPRLRNLLVVEHVKSHYLN